MMKKIKFITLIAFILLINSSIVNAQTMNRAQYIEKYKDIAIRQMRSFGIPASIILAQASLESGNGNSYLAVSGNNHFGIKCHNWSGQTIYHDDDHKNECFRKYSSPEESFNDHSMFLKHRARYSFLFDYDIRDYKSWAHGLKRAGYATNPQYAHLLIKIIEDNQLYRFDLYYDNYDDSQYTQNIQEEAKINISTPSQIYSFNLQRSVGLINRKEHIISVAGDTYEQIASEFSLFKKELLRYNDIKEERALEPGTIVFLERKARNNKEIDSHIVNQGESMHAISQKYGIRLNRLYRINKIKRRTEPIVGTVIKLN